MHGNDGGRASGYLPLSTPGQYLRMTLIKGYNDSSDFVEEFADMMVQGNPHFIELKSYMHIGMSTNQARARSNAPDA